MHAVKLMLIHFLSFQLSDHWLSTLEIQTDHRVNQSRAMKMSLKRKGNGVNSYLKLYRLCECVHEVYKFQKSRKKKDFGM